jgi:hypothetical protein
MLAAAFKNHFRNFEALEGDAIPMKMRIQGAG